MTILLSMLTDTHREPRKVQRVGRGAGSKRGKTCGRGNKGYGSRAGYKRNYGREGGQLPLYRKLPIRGFSNSRFANEVVAINLGMIEKLFQNGETVNLETLRQKGYSPRLTLGGLKILGHGDLKKKVTIEAHHFSASAREKLEKGTATIKEIS